MIRWCNTLPCAFPRLAVCHDLFLSVSMVPVGYILFIYLFVAVVIYLLFEG